MPAIDVTTRRTFLATLLAVPAVASLGSMASAQQTYQGRGEVREINREGSTVTIRHEAIPDLMGAMTMPFRVERASLLEGLSVGARVSFTLGRVEGRLVIRSIRRI